MMTKYRSEFSYAEIEKQMSKKPLFSLCFVSIMINLFFIQAMRAYIPGVYVNLSHIVFGGNIIQSIIILITLSFFFLPGLTAVICKKIKKRHLMIFSICIISMLRLIMSLSIPSLWNTVCSGLIISFYGFYLSTFLTLWMQEKNNIQSNNKFTLFFTSFSCAFLIDYFIRTIGFSEDISLLVPGLILDWQITKYFWLIFQIPLSLSCIYLTVRHFPRFSEISMNENEEKYGAKKSYISLIFIGIGVFLFLQFSLFLYPNIIAQYTSTNYFFNNIINIITLMMVILVVIYFKVDLLLNIKILGVLNGFLLVSLFLFLFLGKVLTIFASVLISISLVVIYLDMYVFIVMMVKIKFKWVKIKSISNILTIGFLFYLIFIILHIITTDWSFTIKAFRGQGPLIIFLAGIILSASSIISIRIEVKRGNER